MRWSQRSVVSQSTLWLPALARGKFAARDALHLAAILAVAGFAALGQAAEPPEVLDDRLTLELVASEPQIVTPTGLAIDRQGRLLVIECHSHFRPDGYQGPEKDRIRLLEDRDQDGRPETWQTFYEGTESTMSLAVPGDGWIYVATRSEIFRLRDEDADGRADRREDLLRLETLGNYPHNGLCGLAFDSEGNLYLGLGENLGEPYRLVGSDGRALAGGGEGGSIFRANPDGTQLVRLATGFWNPFAICATDEGYLLTVDNDPDASPPCRLLAVVAGGDYGYQFRYGRSGRHPLQAWNGELPGTLPMLAGTGEAPCDVVSLGGRLWVTSWGENRIERYEVLRQAPGTRREIVVQGGRDFRPVDFAVAANGSLYFTDWVDVSYPVHGKGRIWRLSWRAERAPQDRLPDLPHLRLGARIDSQPVDLASLESADPFLRQAAVWQLAHDPALADRDWQRLESGPKRLGVLEALRWRHRDQPLTDQDLRRHLEAALRDSDPSVRLFAVRWVADERIESLQADLDRQLQFSDVDGPMLLASLAASEWIERGAGSLAGRRQRAQLLRVVRGEDRPPALRALALRHVPVGAPELDAATLGSLVLGGPEPLQREAARALALSPHPEAAPLVAELVVRSELPDEVRADLVMGLANRGEHAELLERLRDDPAPSVRREARRAVRGQGGAAQSPLDGNSPGTRPAASDTQAWLELIGELGDADAGWRVFFGERAGRCSVCHAFQGRGGRGPDGAVMAPDLTLVGQRMSPRRLIESVLEPSREVAPHYVPWTIECADGRVFTALSLQRFDNDRKEEFVLADGTTMVLEAEAIVARHASPSSIMPSGLDQTLSVGQLRDLMALLLGPSNR